MVNVETEREFVMNPLSVFARMVRSDNVYPLPVVKACFFVRILYAWFQNRRLYNPCWLNYVPIHLSVKLLSAKKCARSVFRKNFVRHCFFQSIKFFLLRYSSCLKSGFASNCFYRKRNYNLRLHSWYGGEQMVHNCRYNQFALLMM